MTPGRAVPLFYSPAYVAAAFGFDTTRKSRWIAVSLEQDPLDGLELLEPEPIGREALLAVHDPVYVRAVESGEPRALAESQRFEWDAALWPMVLASNGGVVAAARTALEKGVAGSLSSGLHHARHGHGAGFCTFNGLVLAAHAAREAGAERVLILDLDAHCGGGTQSLLGALPGSYQVDVAVNVFDSYEDSDRARLDVVMKATDYLPTIQRRLHELDRQARGFDLCLYNAGMDPHQDCVRGGLRNIDRGMLAARERMVFEWCARRRIPVAFVMAGGYVGGLLDQSSLVGLHRLTLAAAATVARRGS